MATNSQLSTTKPKTPKNKNKNKLSKPEQQEKHRYGDHLGVIRQQGEGGDGENVQGSKSIIGRYKVDKVRLGIV